MITGTKVRLRALEPEDIDTMYVWENDISIWGVSGTLTPFSRNTMEQFINTSNLDIYTNKQLRLAIEKIDGSGTTVGYIDLFEFDPANSRAGVGILIGDVASRRQGMALEALNLLSEYAFKILNLHQLFCNIQVNNEPSLRLFSAAGFKQTGELHDWTMNNGSWLNVYIMQKLNNQ